jgi:hypothetical protein
MTVLDNKLKCWKKADTHNHYHMVYDDEIRTVMTVEEATKDTSWWTDGIRKDFNFNKIGTSLFISEADTRSKEGVILPAGCYIHKPSNYPNSELLEIINTRKDKFLNVSKNLNNALTDIETFLKSRKIYDEFGMAYRRGYLLYGPPGNGKTSQIRNLTKDVFANALVIWVNKLPSVEMCLALNDSPLLKVFVMEEVSGRNENSYQMRELLNFFDGETSINNSIVIATTNYPEELEQNLIDRPSRFDLVIEIPNPTNSEAKQYFESFLGRPLEDGEIRFENLSVAHIKEIVLQHKMFGRSLLDCYKQISALKKKIKDAFPEKDKKTMGLGGDADEIEEIKRAIHEEQRTLPR